MTMASPTPVGSVDSAARSSDSRLPLSLAERHLKVMNFSHFTAAAMTSELENTVRLLRSHCITLQSCSERIEGSLLTLGVPTTHALLSAIASVVDGLEVAASSCKRMCDSHHDEVRQREDLFSSLASTYASLKDRHEATEVELRHVIAERDRQKATFERAVEYIESVVAERAAWQAQHGLNAAGLPIVEPTFTQRCRETLAVCGAIARETAAGTEPSTTTATTAGHSADSAAAIVARWESTEAARQCTTAPTARLAFVPPLAEVRLLREVLAMGTGSRALLHDVREERRALVDARSRVKGRSVAVLAELRGMKSALSQLREWLLGLERRGQPFLSDVEGFRSAVRGEMRRQRYKQRLRELSDEIQNDSIVSVRSVLEGIKEEGSPEVSESAMVTSEGM